jgi:hypothetical protein
MADTRRLAGEPGTVTILFMEVAFLQAIDPGFD